jgi:hypothetical protein
MGFNSAFKGLIRKRKVVTSNIVDLLVNKRRIFRCGTVAA